MSKWEYRRIGQAIQFNPSESIKKGSTAKKIPMANLIEFQRKIKGYELAEYKSGPKFRNGDALLAKITPCLENGKTAQVDILDDDEVAFGSSEFIVLRETKLTTSDFVYYLSISPTFRKRAISCMDGTSGRKRVNENTLKFFELPFPGIEEQKQIANILKKLDAKVELNTKINAELEAMAKLLYDYWFVQFDFPFDFAQGKPNAHGKPYKSSGGKMVYNERLGREIPEGWVNGNIMSLANLLGGGTPKTTEPIYWYGNIPFFTPSDVEESIFVTVTKQNITETGLRNCSTKLFSKGTIFITARGTVGKVNVASQNMAMNQSCYAIQGKEHVNPQFLFFYTNDLVHHIKAKASGSIFKAIVSNDFRLTELVIPPKKIIQSYGDFAKPLFEKILSNKLENQQLAELRDWLLPMLMNGQVKVR